MLGHCCNARHRQEKRWLRCTASLVTTHLQVVPGCCCISLRFDRLHLLRSMRKGHIPSRQLLLQNLRLHQKPRRLLLGLRTEDPLKDMMNSMLYRGSFSLRHCRTAVCVARGTLNSYAEPAGHSTARIKPDVARDGMTGPWPSR